MDRFTFTALQYAKGLAASIGGVFTAIVVGLPAIGIDVPQWLAIVTLVVTAVAVIAIPNAPTEKQAEAIVADLAAQGALKESVVAVEVPSPGRHI